MKQLSALLILLIIFSSCSDNSEKNNKKSSNSIDGKLFTAISPEHSGIRFTNPIKQTNEFNFMNYMYIYTGAGVAIGDIDNDGLEDIYAVSNFGPNKLYKNKGELKFEDITIASKTEDFTGFSSGVSMLDINNDGWLDIYVCKAGSLKNDQARRNLLFINQKNGTFIEEAKKWNLDDPGYATQAYPIDYDKDGDLDLYIVNHRYDFQNNGTVSSKIQNAIEETTSDQLYRNDGNTFTNVTAEVGLYNKAWGLSAVVSDFNEDGWDDIFVANDFLEPDVLYINQKNGTFKNEINHRLKHISSNSMGTDFGDIDNDLKQDLIVLDMLSENYARSKENMASMSISGFNNMVAVGYHHAYMANTLHVNTGAGNFIETAQLSGVVKSDWSWAPLFADFDNDGYKDLFITNGIDKDYTNRDARVTLKEVMRKGESMTMENLLNTFPSEKINNYIFKNNGDLTFSKKIKEWGLDKPLTSFGAAYADLDNDGDLDLITNNVDAPLSIYQNNNTNNYIQLKIKGPNNNTVSNGTKVYLTTNENTQLQEVFTTRGYKSSVSSIVHFGINDIESASKIQVVWPDGKIVTKTNIKANTRLDIDYADAKPGSLDLPQEQNFKKQFSPEELGLDYTHVENDFYDYGVQLLLPQNQSTKGSRITIGDVNNDGRDDVFIGNALGSPAALYIQNSSGKFVNSNTSLWDKEAKYEDADAIFVDIDNDGDKDLYVVSAGYENDINSPLLQDRVYINNGNGNFTKNTKALPQIKASGRVVVASDYDNDGDQDLFVGGNVVPGKYPLTPESYLLKNTNGTFEIDTKAPESLTAVGMVSDALFTDYDNDNDLDLFVVGEWMKPTFFTNDNGTFSENETISGLDKTEGWWFSVTASDFDNDGDIDYVVGNLGENNKFKPTEKKPLYIYAKDFDNNGSFDTALSKINNGKRVPVRGKECSSEQNPFLLDKIGTYKEFASLDMDGIYGKEELQDAFQLHVSTFKTVYLENLGSDAFAVKPLDIKAQLGPTLSFVTRDFNNDGNIDIMGVGAIYDAEVETMRYDANFGYVLLGDGNGNFTHSTAYAPMLMSDTKDISTVIINETPVYIVLSNNKNLDTFSF